ncbi:hypothetical protein TNCV_1897351 [Trichonephila clavipes]|nr:hypothetical protein TNCV_1897351 [Trichonephila clavipes]
MSGEINALLSETFIQANGTSEGFGPQAGLYKGLQSGFGTPRILAIPPQDAVMYVTLLRQIQYFDISKYALFQWRKGTPPETPASRMGPGF